MKCYKVQKLLFRVAVGEVPEDLKEKIEFHLASCPECQKELELVKMEREFLRSVLSPEPPSYLLTRILARIKSAEEQRRRAWLPRVAWYMATGLLIAVGIGLGSFIGRSLANNGSTNLDYVTLNTEPSLEELFAIQDNQLGRR